MTIRHLIILLFLSGMTFSSRAQCESKNTTFSPGEKLEYEIYYQWGLIWVNAGEVFFKVDTAQKNNKPAYYIKSYGWTHKDYDWLFAVRDYYETWVDRETLRPLSFKCKTSEGGYKTSAAYTFDYKKKKIYTQTETSDEPFTLDTLNISTCINDVLSALYYVRNMDFSKAEIDKKIPVTFIIENQTYSVYVKYLGKKIITGRDKKKYRCLKFSAYMPDGTIFNEGEGHYFWLTDDENKIPLMITANIFIGAIKVYLEKAEGLRYKQSSIVVKKQ
ncbi:MAG: hypothetical protein A2W91_06930 [Bacteroidetes bacterium GWF2_38_335]|nr:MAG: hypothetical protein A2W91_06930 [Bacteroidetes bacterium GWF2_38_335]OFY80891.1 MAG: hypothetical protein A2281_04775 [Bacteroidetes bacterium RIFOXYA12_FULL_38_20]HBS84951.1 DUF3108 domain-containing protein [Bacteroidales bacterium]